MRGRAEERERGMKFTEAKLEQAIIDLLGNEGYPHVLGETSSREPDEAKVSVKEVV
jgi:type I restriction enzyme R subunit